MLKRKQNFTSISRQLLKVVFFFYFGITILMTLTHFVVEYYQTQDDIKSELELISKTFQSPLEQAVWNFDDTQIKSISQGVLKLPIVLGIEVFNTVTQESIFSLYIDKFNNIESGVFSYKMDLFHVKNNQKEYIATVKYYSNSNIVFDRVKVGFFIIFINSLLKSLILTVLFIWAFRKYLTIPLEHITQNIEKVDLHNLGGHKPISVDRRVNNELTFLSRAFNKMLHSLDDKLKSLSKAQSKLVQSEKMVSLGGMVAGISHEINTPVGMALTGITHNDEQAKHILKLYEDKNMSAEEFENYLKDTLEINKSIQINLEKAASLIRSFKKIAVDQSSNEHRIINIKEYIEEVLLSLHNKIKNTKINILLEIADDINISTNPGAISQIITNFVMNSLIHGFKDTNEGTITILVTIEDDILSLVYKDDGVGLGPETMKKIFDPFYTTNRSNGGSGLGMSIVFNVVTSTLNGTIDIDSKVNNGIIFTIKIPMDK